MNNVGDLSECWLKRCRWNDSKLSWSREAGRNQLCVKGLVLIYKYRFASALLQEPCCTWTWAGSALVQCAFFGGSCIFFRDS